MIEVNPDTVGEFTGLLDKNGKEIYEGDIIRHRYFYNVYKPDFDGEVVFSKSSFRIKFKSEYDKSGFMYWDLCFDDFANKKIEVIGNIHDNSDLLK